MGDRINDFAECLAASHSCEELPFWESCYRKAFPTMVSMHSHREDGDPQRSGIDRSILLKSGKQIWIDEKVRFRNRQTGKVYSDIALERWSDVERRKPWWVVKPLLCDFIAYAIAPLGKCYLLPVIQLQAVWKDHETEWMTRFPIDARNSGYTTRSFPVTPHELFPLIGQMFRMDFEPVEERCA